MLKQDISREENRAVRQFDCEGNSMADLVADRSLDHQIINTVDEGGASCSVPQCLDGNSFIANKKTKMDVDGTDGIGSPKRPGGPKAVTPKAQLHETCAANNWKNPVFECCKEEGPSHKKLFTYKVIVEIEKEPSVLECFSAPKSKKKRAADHAAEGALWYLKQLGYFPINKSKT